MGRDTQEQEETKAPKRVSRLPAGRDDCPRLSPARAETLPHRLVGGVKVIAQNAGVEGPHTPTRRFREQPLPLRRIAMVSNGETVLFARSSRTVQLDAGVPDLRLDVGWESAGFHHGTCTCIWGWNAESGSGMRSDREI